MADAEIDLLITRISRFEPKNWQELANAAKFMEGLLAFRVLDAQEESHAVLERIETGKLEPLEIASAFGEFASNLKAGKTLQKMQDLAKVIHMGARAADMENKPGAFGDQQQFNGRVNEAFNTGVLIENFVVAARIIVSNRILDKADPSIDAAEVLDSAASMLFDGTRETIRALAITKQPKAEAVVAVVEEQLGVVPTYIKSAIITTLASGPV